MIAALLSKLPVAKPADWGFRVTVCIAVRYRRESASTPGRFDEDLILVTDNRVAFGDFSGEYLTIKTAALWHGWGDMFAGNDVEHAEPIIRSSKKSLQTLAKESGRIIRPEEAAQIVDAAYSEQLQARIENKILRKHGFNSESFKKLGKLKCTPEVYGKAWEQIGRATLSLRFLLCGHDENGTAHIWLVDGENAPTSYNSIGFWAIGSGAPAALNRIALYLSRYKEFTSLEEAIYVAITAKFAGEAAANVGRSTFVSVEKHWSHKIETIPLEDALFEVIRISWDSHGIPPVPDVALDEIQKYMNKRKKVVAKELAKIETIRRSASQKSKRAQ